MSTFIEKSKNICYVHIPKTGGTSITETLQKKLQVQVLGKHDNIKMVHEVQIPSYSFCVVRNPWDRMVSFYFHFVQNIMKSKSILEKYKRHYDKSNRSEKEFDKVLKLFDTIGNGYEYFLNNWLLDEDVWQINKINSKYWWLPKFNQTRWISVGGVSVDKIYKFENINSAYREICEIFDLQIELKHIHVSKHSNYRDYYNSKTKRFINKVFKEDIQQFGYIF